MMRDNPQQKPKTLKGIVKDYEKCPIDPWLLHCMSLDTLTKCIKDAATALKGPINTKHSKHPHQHRLVGQTLEDFSNTLLTMESMIQKCKEFDILFEIVKSCKIRGIGELTIYDTALRIGIFLNVMPTSVYFFRGAREGVMLLFNKGYLIDVKSKNLVITLLVSNFPTEFNHLEPFQIEQLLCMYKKDFELLP